MEYLCLPRSYMSDQTVQQLHSRLVGLFDVLLLYIRDSVYESDCPRYPLNSYSEIRLSCELNQFVTFDHVKVYRTFVNMAYCIGYKMI